MTHRFVEDATYWRTPPNEKALKFSRVCHIRRLLCRKGFSEDVVSTIIASWRPATIKQYQLYWKKWAIWCNRWNCNPFNPTEPDVLKYIYFFKSTNLSYSVINCNRSMLSQTLLFFWSELYRFSLCESYGKGLFHFKPSETLLCTYLGYCILWRICL